MTQLTPENKSFLLHELFSDPGEQHPEIVERLRSAIQHATTLEGLESALIAMELRAKFNYDSELQEAAIVARNEVQRLFPQADYKHNVDVDKRKAG